MIFIHLTVLVEHIPPRWIARVFLSLLLYSLLPIASWPSSNLPFSIEAECKAKLNKETLQSYENTFYFLNSMPASVCLQPQQTAIQLNVTGFQTEKEKHGSYLGALKQIINAIKQPTQEKLLGPVQSTTQLPRQRTERWQNIKPLSSLGKGWRQKHSEQFRVSTAMVTKGVSLTRDNTRNLKAGKVLSAYQIRN